MVDTYSLVPRLSGSFSHPTLPGHTACHSHAVQVHWFNSDCTIMMCLNWFAWPRPAHTAMPCKVIFTIYPCVLVKTLRWDELFYIRVWAAWGHVLPESH